MHSAHQSAASLWQFSLRDLARRPGQQREESFTVPAPTVLGTDVIAIPEGDDVELDVSFESVSDGIWVSGTARATAQGECGRCLDQVTLPVTATVHGLFEYPDVVRDDEDQDDLEDVYEFSGDIIDLEQVVRDAVATELPFTPLCEPDCPGLCDQCGARLADDPDHAHEVIDPRWSALQGLTETKES